MSPNAEIDWALPDTLRELASLGDRETVAEVLMLFQTDTGARLGTIREAITANDRPRVRAQAHSLRGSAAQMGACALADACLVLERSAELCAELLPLLTEIETRFALVCRTIALEYGSVQ